MLLFFNRFDRSVTENSIIEGTASVQMSIVDFDWRRRGRRD